MMNNLNPQKLLLYRPFLYFSGGFRGVAKGAVAPPPSCHLRKYKIMNALTLKHMHLVPFLLFAKYNSLHPPMGCIHHTPYFIYLLIKSTFLKTLSILLKNILILHYMGFMHYAKLNTLYFLGGCAPDLLLQRYNFRVPSANPRSAPVFLPSLQLYQCYTILPVVCSKSAIFATKCFVKRMLFEKRFYELCSSCEGTANLGMGPPP